MARRPGRKRAPAPCADHARAVAQRVPAARHGGRCSPGSGVSMRYSVVTPARDEEDNLRRLAAALTAQTAAPLEWLIVDDGSTDATPTLVAALAAEHPWIRRVQRPAADSDEPLAQGRRRARVLEAF